MPAYWTDFDGICYWVVCFKNPSSEFHFVAYRSVVTPALHETQIGLNTVSLKNVVGGGGIAQK
jgi:hypothetical protein